VWRLGDFGLNVEGAINVAAERERLKKEDEKIKDQLEKIEKKLNNSDFLARAPEDVISENRSRYKELNERRLKIESNLKHLPV
jgi:valyl-tRNA synthetase